MSIAVTTTQWFAVGFGAFLVGLDKTGFPGCIYISIALFAQVFDAKLSVGILLPVLLSGDIIATVVFRRHARWELIARLFPFTCIGIVAGFFLFDAIPAPPLFRPLLGGIIIALSIVHCIRRRIESSRKNTGTLPHEPGWVFAGLSGCAGGVATMLANAAGPIAALYFIAGRMPKYEFIGTMAWFFFLVNLLKVPFQARLGILTFSSLCTSAVLAIFCIAGACAGPLLVKHISQKWFERIVWVMIILGAAKLLA